MANFKKGDVVKAAATVPEGPIEKLRMDEDGNVQYQISWTDAEGNTHTRWFSEAALIAA
jgi:hypothetical protein